MTALRIVVHGQLHAIPMEDAKLLAHELRRLGGQVYPSAGSLATALEMAAENELGGDVGLKPLEDEALHRALHGLAVSEDLTDSLRRLWDEIRTHGAG